LGWLLPAPGGKVEISPPESGDGTRAGGHGVARVDGIRVRARLLGGRIEISDEGNLRGGGFENLPPPYLLRRESGGPLNFTGGA